MKRLCIVCEGQTEVEFVKACLTPHLNGFGLFTYPSLLQSRSGNHRGGRVTVERLVKHLSHEFHAADRITTLVDFYGFQDTNGRSRAQLEADILADVAKRTTRFDERFVLPYVQMYEFEGLLFTDIDEFQFVQDGWNATKREALLQIRKAFASPEDINDSRDTAPSKRIVNIFSNGEYSKTEHGPMIAEAIGLHKMRCACAQFNAWLTKLEAWA